MQQSNRKDVARLAGVSEATVSFVYSKKRHVSTKLREKVLEASKELDYYPNFLAASLVNKKSYTISALVNDVTNPFQMAVIKGMQNQAIKNNYFLNICSFDYNLDSYINNFISRKIDGVMLNILPSKENHQLIKSLLDRDISVIVNSKEQRFDERICCIEVDYYKSIELLVRYMHFLGHRKIAYVSCYDESFIHDGRLSGFKNTMKTLYGKDEPLIITYSKTYESNIKSGRILTEELLEKTRDFSAVICSNDAMALGAIKALNKAGLRVPMDISVAGIDNIEMGEDFIPSLTTISNNPVKYGEKIFDTLYNNMQDKSVVGVGKIEPEIIIRDSTAEYQK